MRHVLRLLGWVGLFAYTTLAGLQFGAPWPLTPVASYAILVSPAILIGLALLRDRWSVPSIVALLCGLLMDVITQGALGYWAFIYLMASLIVQLLPGVMSRGWLGRCGAIVFLGLGVFALQLVISWLVFQQPPLWNLLARAALWAAGLGCVLELVVALFSNLTFKDRRVIRSGGY